MQVYLGLFKSLYVYVGGLSRSIISIQVYLGVPCIKVYYVFWCIQVYVGHLYIYLGLFRSIKVYLGVFRCIQVYLGLFRSFISIQVYLDFRSIKVYLGLLYLFWCIQVYYIYLGVLRCIQVYLGVRTGVFRFIISIEVYLGLFRATPGGKL